MDWHLFNDFLVRTVSRDDAINFAPLWKLPAVLCYQAKSSNNVIDNSWKDNLDTSLLYRDLSMTYGILFSLIFRGNLGVRINISLLIVQDKR